MAQGADAPTDKPTLLLEEDMNWRKTIGVYIDALENGEKQQADAAACELMVIADHLNKLGVKYPDMVNETPPLQEKTLMSEAVDSVLDALRPQPTKWR